MDAEKYNQLISRAQNLVVSKHQDYNIGVDLHDYFPFGDTSYLQMLHVKVTRLKALAQNPTKPNFEGKLDTLYDLINYAVFYIEYLRSNAEPAAASPASPVGPEYPTGYVPRKVGD